MDLGFLWYLALKLHFSQLLIAALPCSILLCPNLPYPRSHWSIRFHFILEAYATSAVVSIVMFSGRELEKHSTIFTSHFKIKAYPLARR
jgi:hypothetical protein